MMPSASNATRSETRFYLFEVIAGLARMARRSGEWPVAIHLEAILTVEQLRDEERRTASEALSTRTFTPGREP